MAVILNSGHRHLLRLIAKGAKREDCGGWSRVSSMVFPLLKDIPSVLIKLEVIGSEGEGRVRLTKKGASIVEAMDWLL